MITPVELLCTTSPLSMHSSYQQNHCTHKQIHGHSSRPRTKSCYVTKDCDDKSQRRCFFVDGTWRGPLTFVYTLFGFVQSSCFCWTTDTSQEHLQLKRQIKDGFGTKVEGWEWLRNFGPFRGCFIPLYLFGGSSYLFKLGGKGTYTISMQDLLTIVKETHLCKRFD